MSVIGQVRADAREQANVAGLLRPRGSIQAPLRFGPESYGSLGRTSIPLTATLACESTGHQRLRAEEKKTTANTVLAIAASPPARRKVLLIECDCAAARRWTRIHGLDILATLLAPPVNPDTVPCRAQRELE